MMSKAEIIATTLDQLIEKFQHSPNSFKQVDLGDFCGVMWHATVDSNSQLIPDPTSYARTVLVTWSSLDKKMSVLIYNKIIENFNSVDAVRGDAYISCGRFLERYRANYRKLQKLNRLVIDQKEHSETKEFLTKMSSVFPTMLDHFILGK